MCKLVKAKKEYRCYVCKEPIQVGEKYLRINIIGRGVFHVKRSIYKKYSSDKIIDFCLHAYQNGYDNIDEYENYKIDQISFDLLDEW